MLEIVIYVLCAGAGGWIQLGSMSRSDKEKCKRDIRMLRDRLLDAQINEDNVPTKGGRSRADLELASDALGRAELNYSELAHWLRPGARMGVQLFVRSGC